MWLKVIPGSLNHSTAMHSTLKMASLDFQCSSALRAKDGRATLLEVEGAVFSHGGCEGHGGYRLPYRNPLYLSPQWLSPVLGPPGC